MVVHPRVLHEDPHAHTHMCGHDTGSLDKLHLLGVACTRAGSSDGMSPDKTNWGERVEEAAGGLLVPPAISKPNDYFVVRSFELRVCDKPRTQDGGVCGGPPERLLRARPMLSAEYLGRILRGRSLARRSPQALKPDRPPLEVHRHCGRVCRGSPEAVAQTGMRLRPAAQHAPPLCPMPVAMEMPKMPISA